MKIFLYSKRLSCFLTILFICISTFTFSQITISGKIYDSTKLYTIPEVLIKSTSGSQAFSDSTGEYHINVSEKDSLSFVYNEKATVKFPVKDVKDYSSFDISLHVRVKNKYKLLNTVTVFSNSYHQDSLENREEYAKIFGSEKPGIHSTYDPGGAAGLDLDALIGVFQFRKNKENRAFKNRLIQDEQDRYVDYRFSSMTISRITGLTGDKLEKYKKTYRPSYYFIVNCTLTQFYEYILNTSYAFKRREGIR